ncbi:hypothetical protein PV326_003494, partial [Microctonus aethiopoides]
SESRLDSTLFFLGAYLDLNQVAETCRFKEELIDRPTSAHIEKTENDILELSHNAVNLKSNYLELSELRHVLEKTQVFFTESKNQGSFLFLDQQEEANDSITRALINEEQHFATGRGRLEFVSGVVNRERVPAFERMLWRISRGNVFLRQAELDEPLEDPNTGNEIYKTVFVAFFQGEQLKSRIKKVCAGFHASLYPCPNINAERLEMLKGVRTRLEDLNLVLNQTQDHRQRVLHNVAKEIPNWNIMVRKMKAIYHTMNLFNMDVTKKCLIGECWVPIGDLGIVQNCLTEGSRSCGSSIPSFLNVIQSHEDPPTFHRTNRFTRGFQTLIDSYGVASYREANPALYTIITFPFLFGIMFGDIGHGLIMTIFGAWMVIWEKKLLAKKVDNEIWTIFFGGRYIILLMGIFSMYIGLIYNDIFSKSLNIFNSSWIVDYNASRIMSNEHLELDPATEKGYTQVPYPVGMDPAWALATNKIIFLNSYKMKLSIIFGVVHMIFGVCVSVINIMHFKKYASFFLEFLPQLIFLILIFGYLTTLMIVKYFLYSASYKGTKFDSMCAPSVLITFINMMLNTPPDDKSHNDVLPTNSTEISQTHLCEPFMFDGQAELQDTFKYLAFICIPILLCGKPLYIYIKRSKAKKSSSQLENGHYTQDIELQNHNMVPSNGETAVASDAHSDENEEEPFSDVMVYQAIHTIEYILSTVSHTASYLRLWALSLAHGQLSEVLWQKVLTLAFTIDGEYYPSVAIFIAFALWAFFTIAILVLMEGLSAFLHTLRLHWVEFMSKFYEGHGYLFHPFCFKTIIDTEDAEED